LKFLYFILILGGFLGVVQKRALLIARIRIYRKKITKGKKKNLIPILMLLFSLSEVILLTDG